MWKFTTASDSGAHPHLFSLNGHVGRQVWEFDPDAGTPEERAKVEAFRDAFTENRFEEKHSADELLRMQFAKERPTPQGVTVPQSPSLPETGAEDATAPDEARVKAHLTGAIEFMSGMQAEDGHWPGDYGGPMFLMPGMVIALYVTGKLDSVLGPEHQKEMVRYLLNHQNEDGGYGLHIEGHSTMFGTNLSYVTLRLLGLGPDEPSVARARAWIHSRGGSQYTTSWGKFWLSVLGVYDWMGQNPLMPEAWLLPYSKWTGVGYIHPGRFWCHCRMVYLPMSYLYAARAVGPETELVKALRTELYTIDYATIDWNKARNQCAKEDLYYPHPFAQDLLWWGIYQLEPVLNGSWIRKKAMEEIMEQVHYEDENTRYVDIGPVNKVINMLCCWFEDPEGEAFKKHLPRLHDYLWVAEDGMKMQGYNGSQLWDTAFTAQAIVFSGLGQQFSDCLKKAHDYIDKTQVRDDCPGDLDRHYRHISKGAWPFSTRDHGWPISDCSSEGLKATLALQRLGQDLIGEFIPDDRLQDCVNVILSYQNNDGGWATYENTRSFHALEIINPAETFGDIIVDYSYVECSSACMTALCAFRQKLPDHRKKEIDVALQRGRKFILSIQRDDGSWYGSWGVCFTYGTWFGCEALAALGETYETCEPLRRACKFLLSHQREDGGWGESYLSCQDKVYSQSTRGSQVVNTAWAMMALMYAGYHKVDPKPLHAAAIFLMRMQQPNGDWPQQLISGVFNRNCMITYAAYRCTFPIWAVGVYRRLVLLGEEEH